MKKIFLSAGEASGDLHGAHLIQSLKNKNSNYQFSGMGSEKMRAAGCELLVDCKTLSIIGIFEILYQAKSLWLAMKTLRRALKTQKPDLLILIDYSGFNLRLAKYAKGLGIKILYYVSPHVWAWRRHRILTIKKLVDHMAVIYPFEQQFYEEAGVPVSYVGNSLMHKTQPSLNAAEIYQHLKLNPELKTIGLIPGSRLKEIKLLFPVMLETAQILQKKQGPLQFIVPLAATISAEDLKPYLAHSSLNIKLIHEYPLDALNICDAVIAKSGTVTLELALLGVPMIIIYKLSPLNFAIAKRFIKVEAIGLPNLIAQRKIVPELIQEEANPQKIAQLINCLLEDETYKQQMKKDLAEVKMRLGEVKQENDIGELVRKLL